MARFIITSFAIKVGLTLFMFRSWLNLKTVLLAKRKVDAKFLAVFGEPESSEIVRVKGEFILRSSPTGRDLNLRYIVHENDNNRIGFVLQKFRGDTGNPMKETSFSFYDNEFHELLEFLNLVRFIDLSDTNNFKLSLSNLRDKVLVNKEDKELLDSFTHLDGEHRVNFLEKMR